MQWRHLIRNFILEMVIYGVLVSIYLYAVLQLLREWLLQAYSGNTQLYAVSSLALIVIQGVLFEMVTTNLINWLGLERLE